MSREACRLIAASRPARGPEVIRLSSNLPRLFLARHGDTPWTDARWKVYATRYRREMREPGPRHLLELLARLSHQTDFAIGCYCEREDRCHRSLLRELLAELGGKIARD